jgi:hypothetical protein
MKVILKIIWPWDTWPAGNPNAHLLEAMVSIIRVSYVVSALAEHGNGHTWN